MISLLCHAAIAVMTAAPASDVDSIDGWTSGVRTTPVLAEAQCHSIHSYFNVCPESPDSRWVLVYRSTTPEGHDGEVCVVERQTGAVRVLATGVTTEDAHRAACQQWSQGGKTVVFHDLRDGHWVVVAVDVVSGEPRILARDRQVCWGQPHGVTVPLYGPHWAPSEHRNLELVNVRTGEVRTVLTADAVRLKNFEWIEDKFGDRPISIFFPILSPDQRRVMFKLATPAGGDFRSPRASDRFGLIVYDLEAKTFVYDSPRWGHPAWHPSSRKILNTSKQGVALFDIAKGSASVNEKLPRFPGSHPSLSPSGELFVTDARIAGEATPDARDLWGVAVGSLESGEHIFLARFENGRGASSWRPSHPHPVFSRNGRRIYYNVSSGPWTRLFVAEQATTGRE